MVLDFEPDEDLFDEDEKKEKEKAEKAEQEKAEKEKAEKEAAENEEPVALLLAEDFFVCSLPIQVIIFTLYSAFSQFFSLLSKNF